MGKPTLDDCEFETAKHLLLMRERLLKDRVGLVRQSTS